MAELPRVHVSSSPNLTLSRLEDRVQYGTPDNKPNGLWYGVGSSWVNFVAANSAAFQQANRSWKQKGWRGQGSQYLYSLDIDFGRVLRIRNAHELDRFEKAFTDPKWGPIRWDRVAWRYSGIEIAPVIYERQRSWYYGWDVASGCIWDTSAIKKIKKIRTVTPDDPDLWYAEK